MLKDVLGQLPPLGDRSVIGYELRRPLRSPIPGRVRTDFVGDSVEASAYIRTGVTGVVQHDKITTGLAPGEVLVRYSLGGASDTAKRIGDLVATNVKTLRTLGTFAHEAPLPEFFPSPDLPPVAPEA